MFFGLFTPLQGAPVIGAALAALADDEGRRHDGRQRADHEEARSLAAANHHVTWVDWVPPDQLPALVARHDVCLGIFGTGPKALRVVPNKVFQGRPPAARSSRPTPRRSAGCSATPRSSCPPAIRRPSRLRCATSPSTAIACRQPAARPPAWPAGGCTPAAVTAPLLARLHAVVPRRLPT